jgi:hypothetical protein
VSYQQGLGDSGDTHVSANWHSFDRLLVCRSGPLRSALPDDKRKEIEDLVVQLADTWLMSIREAIQRAIRAILTQP